MRIAIAKDGSITAVYSDLLRKLNLGKMQVTRASNVEFNTNKQEWEAKTLLGEVIASGRERNTVIEKEIQVIESRL